MGRFDYKKVYKWLAPDAAKEDDGRDKWPSRASFILAAMVSLSASSDLALVMPVLPRLHDCCRNAPLRT